MIYICYQMCFLSSKIFLLNVLRHNDMILRYNVLDRAIDLLFFVYYKFNRNVLSRNILKKLSECLK